ncbi:hypothetical protein NDU88_007022 [Pleurodeles waltl]|uniref:Uncharacterized protein n=1 Tax=Pleurodeles waltl TaxID=8319 RepID=A0AAV7WHB5_PLEWA|nr:hypothetical protein NDU88_007022 [Pleurodeles waltl]
MVDMGTLDGTGYQGQAKENVCKFLKRTTPIFINTSRSILIPKAGQPSHRLEGRAPDVFLLVPIMQRLRYQPLGASSAHEPHPY